MLRLDQRPEMNIEAVVQHRHALQRQKANIEHELELVDEALEEYLVSTQRQKASIGDYTVSRVSSTRRTLDKHKLVEQGVLPSVIDAATRETPYSFVRVSRAGDDDGQ